MSKMQISEAQLQRMISESIDRVLREEMEEGLFDRIRNAYSGAKAGYNAQKTLDRGTDDFKQQHDWDDVRGTMDNPLSKQSNTAEEQARSAYEQYKNYQQQANKMLNLYNQLCRKYGLQKQSVGNFKTTAPAPTSTGVNFQQQDPHFGKSVGGRNNDTRAIGNWGK